MMRDPCPVKCARMSEIFLNETRQHCFSSGRIDLLTCVDLFYWKSIIPSVFPLAGIQVVPDDNPAEKFLLICE